ncbi:hypothetical protein AB833_22425 [Chromatiales bacterium (ex Bugula neritina AB1)]|nr:hypothetical protein AB833_22425 [Chromatiales bacterium (ex Bugula neritina AB1)]
MIGKWLSRSRGRRYNVAIPCIKSVLFSITIVVSPVALADFFGDQLVKETYGYYVFPDNGTDWPFSLNCNAVKQTSVSTFPAPGNGDPGVQTSNPVRAVAGCPIFDVDGNGQPDHNFDLRFDSLEDQGEWRVTCTGSSIDPAHCVASNSPPCYVACDANFATAYSNASIFNINVFNDLPTASPDHSPTPAWNNTVTLDADAVDPDGGSLSYSWSIVNKPSASNATLNGSNTDTPTISFNDDNDIGFWRFQVHVDDNEGERRSFNEEFTIPNIPPDISINGVTSVDALLEDIELQVNSTSDTDGGTYELSWDLDSAPPSAGMGAQNGFSSNESISIQTTDDDIGTWIFRVTATDNENDTDFDTHSVEVRNIPPEINLTGTDQIVAGESIIVETTILDDLDGGDLSFSWDLVQVPQSSNQFVQYDYFSGTGIDGATLTIPTSEADAGTWIVRLIATDDDASADSEIEQEFTILVDGPVTAEIQGDELIGNLSFPLVLDASNSEDADSPCPSDPTRCHDTLEGQSAVVSAGIVEYTWYLVDVPFEYFSEYALGRVDDALGAVATAPALTLDFGSIRTGDWVFEVEVVDAEGNFDTASFTVTVIDETGPPFAFVSGPKRFSVDLNLIASEDVGAADAGSFDADNLLTGDPFVPGVGIEQYQWSNTQVPVGCTAPVPPSGPSATEYVLFPAGTAIPAPCMGYWSLTLDVTDDDTIPKSASSTASVIIGNCETLVCIDYPTTLVPESVEFSDATDVLIYYRLDATVYDDPQFQFGLYARLAIFHESDLVNPVYTDFDPNVQVSSKGSFLTFHWNGYSDTQTRPQPGNYTVSISLYDYNLGVAGPLSAIQIDAIQIEVAEPEIAATSDRYIDLAAFNASPATDTVDIQYLVNGSAVPDQIRWRVLDSSASVVHEITQPHTGSISWDGKVGGVTLPADAYTLEIDLLLLGNVLGTSPPHHFVFFELSMELLTGVLPEILPAIGPPTALILVNSDDDNGDGVADNSIPGLVVNEDDLIEITLSMSPASLPPELHAGIEIRATSGAANIKIFDTITRSTQYQFNDPVDLTATALPGSVFVEGQSTGNSTLELVLRDLTANTDIAARTQAVQVHDIDIDVDSNMDGSILASDDNIEEEDEALIIYVNNDDDGGSGNDAASNAVIENATDKTELTDLIIRRNAGIVPGSTLTLSVSDKTKIRLFDQTDTARIGPPAADGGPDADTFDIPLADVAAADLDFHIEAVHGGVVDLNLVLTDLNGIIIGSDSVKLALNVNRQPGNTESTIRNRITAVKSLPGLVGFKADLTSSAPVVSWDPSPPKLLTTSFWVSLQDSGVTHWIQTGVRRLRSTAGVNTEEIYFEYVSDYPAFRAGTNLLGYQRFVKPGSSWVSGEFKVEISDSTTGEAEASLDGVVWQTVDEAAMIGASFDNYQIGTEPKQTVSRIPGSSASKAQISNARYKDSTGWHNTALVRTDITIDSTNGRGVVSSMQAVAPSNTAVLDDLNYEWISGQEFDIWDDRN